MREIYGTRRIDASAPQSDRDATPSGRLRYMEQQGVGPDGLRVRNQQDALEQDFNQWRKQFGQVPPVQMPNGPVGAAAAAAPAGMPDGWRAQRNPLQQFAEPDDILEAFTQGAVSGQFKTPFGPASFTTPQASPLSIPLNAAAPIPAKDLSQFVPAGLGAGATVPWKQQAKPAYMSGIFAGASRWT